MSKRKGPKTHELAIRQVRCAACGTAVESFKGTEVELREREAKLGRFVHCESCSVPPKEVQS